MPLQRIDSKSAAALIKEHLAIKEHLTKRFDELMGGPIIPPGARIFGAFQDAERPRIIVADPGVMAHGLNLYAARTVVWYGPTDKAELYMQGNKRAHRPGQTWPVTIVQLVASELEADIYHRVATNTSLQGAMLDAVAKDRL